MRKYISLLLVVLLSLSLVPVVTAQEDFMESTLMPRLEAYGSALEAPYGTLKLADFQTLLAEEEVLILDVREVAEVEEFGIIEGAYNIPMRTLGENLGALQDLEAPIVVVCKAGFRATIAMTALQVLGYENVKVLVGGFDAWLAEELPVAEAGAEFEVGELPEAIDPAMAEFVGEFMLNLPEGWGGVKADALFEEMFEEMPDLLLDVRSAEEWAEPGYIEGATHVWVNEFMENLDVLPEDKEASIVVYCASSYRAGIVATMLRMMGYENVRNMAGGINAWVAAELPLVQPS